MGKQIDVQITEDHNYYGRTGLFNAEIGIHNLVVSQNCIDKLNDMTEGKWNVELDNGKIILVGKITIPFSPNRCKDCGKRIFCWRTWCDDCFLIKVMK